MESFNEPSMIGVAKVGPYDPTADLTFGERLTRGGGFAEAYDAAERSQRLVANTAWEKARIEDAYATLIDKVKTATGVTLDNPMMVNTAEITARIAKGEFHGFTDPRLGDLVLQRRDAFTEKLAELKAQHPDTLSDLDPFTDPRALGAANARKAEADSAAVWENRDANPVLKGAGLLAGGFVGYLRDPTFVASLFAPAGGQGATATGRIASAAVTQGLVNAGLMAASEPAIQEGRAAAGLENGWGQALGDVAAAAAFGAIPGAGIQTAQELGAVIGRLRAGRATMADVEAVKAAGVHVSDDTAASLAAAERFDAAHAEALAARPEGIPEHAAPMQLAEGMRAVDDPSAPLPLVDRPIAPGTTDDLARNLVDGSSSVMDGVERLRATAGAIDSALASVDPLLRDVGRLATLDADVIALVDRGDLPLTYAAIVAATTPDPRLQAAAVAALGEARPATVEAARLVVSDVVDARVRLRRPAYTADREQSLLQFLAASGGLRDDPEVRAIFDGNPFLPGYGRLIRKKGMTLDHAREVAVESGYLIDPGLDAGHVAESTPMQLLDAISLEARGLKQYRFGVEPAADVAQPVDARTLASAEKTIREAVGFSTDHEVDTAIVADAAYRLASGEVDSAIAAWDAAAIDFERALMRESDAVPELLDWRLEDVGQIPGWDFPHDVGSASTRGDAHSRSGSGEAGGFGATVGPRETPRPAGASARGATDDLRNAVPLIRDDGSVEIVSRADLGRVAERERWFGEVIAACKS